jgi:hypothetical protein
MLPGEGGSGWERPGRRGRGAKREDRPAGGFGRPSLLLRNPLPLRSRLVAVRAGKPYPLLLATAVMVRNGLLPYNRQILMHTDTLMPPHG